MRSLQSCNEKTENIQKTVEAGLHSLAFRAKMRAAASHQDALDGSTALPARLAGALVNAVLELKEAAYAVRRRRNRKPTTRRAGWHVQHFAQRQAQPLQFGAW